MIQFQFSEGQIKLNNTPKHKKNKTRSQIASGRRRHRTTDDVTERLMTPQNHRWRHRITDDVTKSLMTSKNHWWRHRITDDVTESQMTSQNHWWLHKITDDVTLQHYSSLSSLDLLSRNRISFSVISSTLNSPWTTLSRVRTFTVPGGILLINNITGKSLSTGVISNGLRRDKLSYYLWTSISLFSEMFGSSFDIIVRKVTYRTWETFIGPS